MLKERIFRTALLLVLPLCIIGAIIAIDTFVVHYVVAWKLLLISAWLTLWWATGVVPLGITSLLPLILFPLFAITPAKDVFASYSHPIIFLFLGGFFYAIALQKSGLHRRIAINLMLATGKSAPLLILGIMLATALSSMFMSNTVTAMMMYPLAIGICTFFEENASAIGPKESMKNFRIIAMIAVAYSASLGGMATIIGSPPNAIAVGIIHSLLGIEVSFAEWFIVGMPIATVLLLLTWCMLLVFYPVRSIDMALLRGYLLDEKQTLSAMSNTEKILIWIGVLLLLGWIGNDFAAIPLLSSLSDTQVALLASVALFAINVDGKPILDTSAFSKVEWNILYMFGAGFALSAAFGTIPFQEILSHSIIFFTAMHPLIIVVSFCLFASFITEFTSNSSVSVLLLPIVAAFSATFSINPIVAIITVCLSASCAFMFPSSTPSNAIVFGSGYILVSHLLRVGVVLTILCAILLGGYGYYIIPLFGIR